MPSCLTRLLVPMSLQRMAPSDSWATPAMVRRLL